MLNTRGVTIGQSGILELANTGGSATGPGVGIANYGIVLVSAGLPTVGAFTGSGITQVTGSASPTAASINQSTLVIGTVAADASLMRQAPEPSSVVLFVAGAIGLLTVAGRRIRQRFRIVNNLRSICVALRQVERSFHLSPLASTLSFVTSQAGCTT